MRALSSVLVLSAVVLGACSVADSTQPVDANESSTTPPAGPSSELPPTAAPSVLVGARLYVDPDSPARRQANAWRASRPADATMMERIAAQSVTRWIGDWNRDVARDVSDAVSAAMAQGALPVLVVYNIPHRDCGEYSAGGAASGSAYRQWIRDFAAGLAGRKSAVLLEPDAVPSADCLSTGARSERNSLLRDAIQVLKGANATVYLDAGNAKWMSPGEIASRLIGAGIQFADGFSLNVSNFLATDVSVSYGESVSRLVGGRHFVVDVSRNGMGAAPNGVWCNPPGRALGPAPTTQTGHPLADAYLWVKYPGESDGTCNGGPVAGEWWAEYALGLAQRQPVP